MTKRHLRPVYLYSHIVFFLLAKISGKLYLRSGNHVSKSKVLLTKRNLPVDIPKGSLVAYLRAHYWLRNTHRGTIIFFRPAHVLMSTTASMPEVQKSTCNLVWALLENLIPYHYVRRGTLNTLVGGDIPSIELVLYAIDQLYADYKNYFREYFKRVELSVSISCHNWTIPGKLDTFMMISAHYTSAEYRFCEVPLCFFPFSETSLPSMIVHNQIPEYLGGQLATVLSSHPFSAECLNVLQFGSEDQCSTLICTLSFLLRLLGKVLKESATCLGVKSCDPDTLQYSLSQLAYTICEPFAKKLRSSPLKLNPTAANDPESKHFGVLVSRTDSFSYLQSAMVYKQQIEGLLANEWVVMELAVRLHMLFAPLVELHSSNSHSILKWLMALVVKLTRLAKYTGKAQPQIAGLLEKAVADIRGLHAQYESVFDIVLASYLHPSARCFLREHNLTQIHQYLETNAHEGPVDVSWSSEAGLEIMDEVVMNHFHCLGTANECYRYELQCFTLSEEMGLSNNGSLLLKSWKQKQAVFPELSKQARRVLSVPISSGNQYSSFKASFPAFLASLEALSSEVDVQALFVLHRLSVMYDVSRFDPKNLGDDIEQYRIPEFLSTEEAEIDGGQEA